MQRLSPYDQYEQREHPEWNLPPGVTPDDIERLYADPEPPEDAACGGCAHAARCRMLDGEEALICTCDPCAMEEVEAAQAACSDWEDLI